MSPPASPGTSARGEVLERLWPAAWVWGAVAVLAACCALVVARLDGVAALVTLPVSALVLGGALVASAPVVGVRDGEFVAGRAHVPLALVGRVEPLDEAAMRHAVGPGLDARSYLCLRGWVGTGLRLELCDPHDPTPSWVVSSRRPAALAAAVESARRG